MAKAPQPPTFLDALEAFGTALRAEIKATNKEQAMGAYIGTLCNVQQMLVRLEAQQYQLQINEKMKNEEA